MMSPLRKMAFKLAAYSVFVLYLIGDLYIWHGFLADRFDDHFKPMPKGFGDSSQTVALVYGEPITKAQLDRRMMELAWFRGSLASLKEGRLSSLDEHQQRTLKIAALNDLVNAALLRLKTRVIDLSLDDTKKEAGNAVDKMESRFLGGHEAFMNSLVSLKTTPERVRDQVAARLKQEQKLESMMIDAKNVSDNDLQWYYNQVKDKMMIPAHRSVQHLFLASLDKDEKMLEVYAGELLAKVNSGIPLDEMAKKFSEDPRSAKNGGHLGVIYRDRDVLPGVDLWKLPAAVPVLTKSRTGWHIMRLGELVPARIPTYAEAKNSLLSALVSLRKERAADIYASNIRREGRQAGRVEISPMIVQ